MPASRGYGLCARNGGRDRRVHNREIVALAAVV